MSPENHCVILFARRSVKHALSVGAVLTCGVFAGLVLEIQHAVPSAASTPCPAGWTYASNECQRTWSTGSATFTLPSGLTRVYVRVTGAQGGAGGVDSASTAHRFSSDPNNRGIAGQVGQASGWIPVTGAGAMGVYVGGSGGNGSSGYSYNSGSDIVGVTGSGGVGGTSSYNATYNGGAGAAGGPSNWSGGGGGGGAASLVVLDGEIAAVGSGGGGGGGGGGTTVASSIHHGRTGLLRASGSAGEAGVRAASDGGGGGGGGGGYVGGLGGTPPGGDSTAYGGSAGQTFISAGATSASTSFVSAQVGSIYIAYPALPSLSSSPTIAASPAAGATATGSGGTWNGADALTYQWLRCSTSVTASSNVGALSLPGGCTAISGADALTYIPTTDDLGSYLVLGVSATNAAGTVSALSSSSGPIPLSVPTVDLLSDSDTGLSDSDNLTADATPSVSASNVAIGADVTFTATKGLSTETCGPVRVSSVPARCTFGELVDGTWSVSAYQSFGGTDSASSATLPVAIDTAEPAAPSGISLAASSDSGVSTSDEITSDSTPEIELSGLEVGNKVVVTASKSGSASVTCEIANVTSTAESCIFGSALGDGEWTFSAVQIDDAGNSSPASASITARIDTAAGVSLSSTPAPSGTSATASSAFTVRATLTDAPDGVSAFTSSDITIGGTSTGWAIDATTWRQISPTVYEFVVSAANPTGGTLLLDVPSGSYADVAGNTATASVQWKSTIVVDPPLSTAAPAISATRGSVTTLGSSLATTDGLWNDRGDISPTTSYQWQICPDATGVGCTNVAGATSSTWTPTAAAEGKYVRSLVTRENVAGETDQASALVGPMTKSAQEIDFTNPGTKTYSPSAFSITPVSEFPSSNQNTGLTVQMSSLTPSICSVTGLSVTMLQAGTCSLAADQSGNAQFDPATQVVQTFTINPATENPTTTPASNQVQPGQRVALSTNNGSRGAVTYSVVSGSNCSIVGNEVVASGVGDCVIATSVAGDGRYNASTPGNVTISVRETDAVSGPVIADQLRSNGAVAWSPTSLSARIPASGMTVTTTGPCNYDSVAAVITPTGDGQCTVNAAVTDNGSWSAASLSRTFSFVSPPSSPTITSVSVSGADEVPGAAAKVALAAGSLNGSTFADYSVTATPVGGGATVTVTCLLSPCTVTGLDPSMAYTFTAVTNARGAGLLLASSPSTASTQVTTAAVHPVILVNPGNRAPGSSPFSVTATSGIDPTWTPTVVSLTPSVCSVSGSTVTLVGTGTCTLQASHIGGNSGGIAYGYGVTAVSFRVGVASGSAWPTGGDNGQGAPTLTPCQMAAVEGRALPGCPLVNPLPDANGGDESVGIGGGNGAPATQGLIQPPAPVRTVVERLPDGRNAKVTVTVRQDKPNAPVRAVVFIVFDPDGKVVARIAVEVPEGQETVVATVPFLEEGYQVRTYTTNEAGVSNKAPIGANVLNQPTTLGKRGDGTPILFGKRIARPVLFDPDSPQLGVRARQTLDRVVRFAERNGGRVFITGFVRNQGGSVRDQKALSNARAEQVAMYLSRRGVDTWIRYNGYGAYRKGQGEPQDRRVEVRWSNDEIPGLRATAANPVYAAESSGS